MRILAPLSLALCLAAAPHVLAVSTTPEGSLQDRVLVAPRIADDSVSASDADAPRASFDRFVLLEGGQWWGRLLRDSGRASLLSGSGLPILAGTGNALPGPPVVDLSGLEQRVRALIERHPGLLAPTAGDLRLSAQRSGVLRGGRVAFVDFDLVVGGVLVRGARVFARVNNGNVVQLGTRLADGVATDTEALLTVDDAAQRMFEHAGGRTEIDVLHGEPETYLLPWQDGGALAYRLVHEVAFRRAGEIHTWTARVDARSGEVLEFFDANKYGQVTGGIFPRTVTDPEITVGFPFVQVDGAGVTDRSGSYTYAGGQVSTGLEGPYVNTNCNGCTSPSQAFDAASVGLGWLRLGTGGTDEIGNGVSTRAERMGFYHVNLIREVGKKWLTNSWLDSNILIDANVADTCNATYGGNEINLFRSGGGCNNTGEISDVIYHEWGHGVDGNTLGGDSATGEGTGDTVSFAFTHGSEIGPEFRTDGSPVRDVNSATTSKGLITNSNASSKCGTGPCLGPQGLECHCEGEIYGQTGWDLAQALVTKHGFHTGWQVHEQIFYEALPQSGTYLPDQADSIYDAYLAVDDDDGNLNNGTPNGQEIHDAFALHEIASNGPAPSSTPGCVRPAEPVVTITSGCDGLTLSWAAVPGATEYRILRNSVGASYGFIRVGSTAGTSFVDSEVIPDETYHYVVETVDGGGCTSTIEGVQSVSGPARPIVGIVQVDWDDTPMGNRSGSIDPGEAVDVTLTVENFTGTAAGSISGTLSSPTSGITIDVPVESFPNLAGFGSGQSAGAYRFSIDSSVACGTEIDFDFTLTDDSGCAAETQHFGLKVGDDAIRQEDSFATDLGWSHDAVNSTATAGDWTRGDPDGTSAQPEFDSDDSGNSCWYTAPNAGGAGTDDVDNGEVILVSPLFDLSTLTNPSVSYQRWFSNRDLGEDPDDYFWVEVSDDGGSSWQTVELLGSNDTAPQWTDVSFGLTPLIALTSTVQFRVRVSDGTLTGNLIEGAFDDFRITEPECDLTPPCFIPPTFGGLDQSSAGPDCAEASLSWLTATSSCQNATISYNVYRSTTSGFTPDPATLIAGGLTGLSFVDALLTPNVTYHYVVRAFDSRSGEESNSLEGTVLAPSSPDTKAPLFTGLTGAATGSECGETVLSWPAAQESCSTPVVYNVYRSTTPGFTPDATTLVGQTTGTSLVDAGLSPNTDFHYVVRAEDLAGLEDGNAVELTVEAKVKDLLISLEDFESDDGGWSRSGLNDATTGLWEHGDPVGTLAQPDNCPSGTSCWATGLTGPGLGDNDIDGGTTTLITAPFDLTGLIEPGLRFTRYYSNDTGQDPGNDTWSVDISNDGSSWSPVESTTQSDQNLVFTEVEYSLDASVSATTQMQVRFTASDLGSGSLVEAMVDDFRVVDLAGGCDGCGAPPSVGTIFVTIDGTDVMLDWTADPVMAGRFKVYALSGATFADASLVGTSDGKTFRHAAGAGLPGLTSYRVSAVDACGQEGPLM